MVKKKKPNEEGPKSPREGLEAEIVKYSLLVPKSLHDKLTAIMSRRHMRVSSLVREVLEDYVRRVEGSPSPDANGITLAISLDDQTRSGLEMLAKLLNLDLSATVQTMVFRGLPEAIEQARVTRKRLEEALGASPTNNNKLPKQREDHQPRPT